MSIEFTNPTALLFLVILPGVVYLLLGRRVPGRESRPSLSRTRALSVLAARLSILVLVTLALAGIRTRATSRDVAAIFLVDVSSSIARTEEQSTAAFINRAIDAAAPGDYLGIIAFGREPSVELAPTRKELLGDWRLTKLNSNPSGDFTDVESALRLASALVPQSATGRIVLMSDGNENVGSALRYTGLLNADRIEVSSLPLKTISEQQGESAEIAVREITGPELLSESEAFDLGVTVDATRESNAVLRLFRNDSLIAERQVHLMPSGSNAFVLPQRIEQKGFYTYRAQVESLRSDSFAQNNSAEALVMVAGRPKTLYLYGDTQPSAAITRVLKEGNFDADIRSAGGLPATIAGLHDFDLIIFDNVPAASISRDQMNAVKAYVHDLGGGFVMIGGDKSFGAGGYYKTPIEDVLPVSLDLRNKKHFPSLALVLVIDRSGSMNERQLGRAKIQLAAEAASAAVDTLSDRDSVGVIAFDDEAHPIVQLTGAENKKPIHKAIEGITALGGTNMYPGLKLAYDWLIKSDSEIKHIIVLSDGESQPGNFRQIARSIRDAGTSLSSVAVGDTADLALMRMLADAGGGRYYEAGDPQSLAAIFTREAFLASGAAVVEEPFVPVQKQPAQATSGIDWGRAPRLLGYAGAAEREPATPGATPPAVTALVSHKDDPIYAVWQFGLGRSAAFTPDLKPRWASEWMNWPGLGQFATQMLRDVVRRSAVSGEYSLEPRLLFSETREGARLGQLSVNAFAADGRFKNDLRLHARIVAPGLSSTEVDLDQTEAGHYEASFPATERGSYLVNFFDERGQSLAITGAVKGYSREYTISPPDLEFLRQVAETTGGRLISAADAVKSDASAVLFENRQPRSTPREIWRSILIAAILLLPLDVGLRRIHITREDMNAAAQAVTSRSGAVLRAVFGIHQPAQVAAGHESVGRLKASRRRVRLRGADHRGVEDASTREVIEEVTVSSPKSGGSRPVIGDLPVGEEGEQESKPADQASLAGHLLRIKKKRE